MEQAERTSRRFSGENPYNAAIAVVPQRGRRTLSDMDDASMSCIDLDYEHEMQRKLCHWIAGGTQGHFLRRTWVLIREESNKEEEVALHQRTEEDDANNVSTACIPLHTHVRNIQDEALVHDQHPFVALIYLLRHAETSSTVYISVPFLTDMHILDELCYYAKPVAAGGRDLKIRVILGPQRWVTVELSRFVNAFSQNGCQAREEAIGRLEIRKFGTDIGTRSSLCHSKAMVSTAGAMIGSYNFTYSSRYRHREDGCYMSPGTDVDNLRQRLHDIWDSGDPVAIRRFRPPPGYNPSLAAKRPVAAIEGIQLPAVHATGEKQVQEPVVATGGLGPHLVPAKRLRRNKQGELLPGAASARCRQCGVNSTVVCSTCVEQGVPENKAHYCKPGKQLKTCFATHLSIAHSTNPLVDDIFKANGDTNRWI